MGDSWGWHSFWKNTAILTLVQVPSNTETWKGRAQAGRCPHSPLQPGGRAKVTLSKHPVFPAQMLNLLKFFLILRLLSFSFLNFFFFLTLGSMWSWKLKDHKMI